MGDEMSGGRGEQKGFGCAKMAGVGCLVLIVLGLVLSLVVYFRAKGWARAGAASLAEVVGAELRRSASRRRRGKRRWSRSASSPSGSGTAR